MSAALLVAGCGTSPATSGPTAALDTQAAPVSAPVDRSWPYDTSIANCNLPRILVNSSHLLDVTTGVPVVAEGTPIPPSGDPTTSPVYDTAAARINQVIEARGGDPRASFFGMLTAGSALTLGSPLPGSVLADIAGQPTIVAVGQFVLGTPQAWRLNAALRPQADGRLAFAGPCGVELDRQLLAIAAGFGAKPDVAFVATMIEGALRPGRITDLDYFATPNANRGIDFGLMPPSLVGKLRVIGLYVTPVGNGGTTVGMTSPFGLSALSSTQAASGAGWLLPAIVPLEGPAEFVEYRDAPVPGGAVVRTLISLSAQELHGVFAIHVTLDVATMTATWQPVDEFQLATLSGYSVASLESLKRGYEHQLATASRDVPHVEFSEQAPVSS